MPSLFQPCPLLQSSNPFRFALWIKRSAAVAATRLLLDAPLPLLFFLAVARSREQAAAVLTALLLLLLRVLDAFAAGLASAIALRISDHLSAAHALRARAAAAAAVVAALALAAAAAAAAALGLPYAAARFCLGSTPLSTSLIASAAAAAAAAAAAGAVEGLLYGQGRVAIINASGIFAHWVRIPRVVCVAAADRHRHRAYRSSLCLWPCGCCTRALLLPSSASALLRQWVKPFAP
jgi:hypothetical protein